MNKEAYKMLKEIGIWKRFLIMMILRAPFDILNAVLTANLLGSFLRIAEQENKDRLVENGIIFLAFTILLFAYNMIVWSVISSKTTVLLQKGLRKKVFEEISKLPSDKLQGEYCADWFTRLNNDVDKASGYLTMPLNYMHMVIAAVNLIISSVIMLIMNKELYAIGMVPVFAAFFLNVFVISKRITEYKKKAQKGLVEYTEWIDMSLKNDEVLAIFDGKDFVREKIEEKSLTILKENMKAHNCASLCNMFYAFSGMFGYLMIMVKGNDIMGKGMNDFAELVKYTQYRANSLMSVNCVYNSIGNMKGNFVGVERVNEVILKEKE